MRRGREEVFTDAAFSCAVWLRDDRHNAMAA